MTRKEARATKHRRHRRIFVGLVLLVLAFGGVAVALWSSSGGGTGEARALAGEELTVTASTGTADLFPGFKEGDIYFAADNPNPYAVTFTSFQEAGISSSDERNCPASNVTVDSSAAIGVVVSANASGEALSIADVVTMSSLAPDACQGVAFTITLTLSGSQS
jgi:hypothetical protein